MRGTGGGESGRFEDAALQDLETEDGPTSQGTQVLLAAGNRSQKGRSPDGSTSAQRDPFGALIFRTVRSRICVVSASECVVICYSSKRTPRHTYCVIFFIHII